MVRLYAFLRITVPKTEDAKTKPAKQIAVAKKRAGRTACFIFKTEYNDRLCRINILV